jgi:hypothetical protein
MPIVINEIEINVEVTPNNNSKSSSSELYSEASSREAIIKECVEKIMEIINQKNER